MKSRLFIGALAISAMGVAANAATITDDFSGTTLNPMWQVNDNASSYNTGGGAGLSGSGYYLIHNSYVEGASNISTSMGNLGAGDTARLDGIVRTDQFNDGRWSNQVVIYFDNENWVGLRLAYENGKAGYERQGAVNGVYSALDGTVATGNIQWAFNILGVELTPTNIIFYGSTIGTDHSGDTDIDGHSSLLATVARPASFQGQAYAILGKGFAANNLDPAFLNHNGGSTVSDTDNYIDYARIITPDPVPEPATLGLLALFGLPMLGRRNRRS